MASELSLEKINSLWQYSASTAEADGEGVPLSDTLSCMDFDDDGRAFFYFANKKGLRYSLDVLAPENSALGTAIARIRLQQVSMLSWDSADDTMVYLDQNYEFANQVLSPWRIMPLSRRTCCVPPVLAVLLACIVLSPSVYRPFLESCIGR